MVQTTNTFVFWSFSSCVSMTLFYHQYEVMQKLTVRFSDKEYQDLTRLSQKAERSLNDLIREAIRQYMEKETKG